MILRNKTSETLKRFERRWVRVRPGETIVVTDAEGKYLLSTEPYYWEDITPDTRPAPKKKATPKKKPVSKKMVAPAPDAEMTAEGGE